LVGEVLRRDLDDVLAVYEIGERGGVFAFRGQLAIAPAQALELLRERFQRVGYTPFIRPSRGGVLVQAWPTAVAKESSRVMLNVVLFVLTMFSTLLAGSMWFVGSPTFDALRSSSSWVWRLFSGVPFAGTLLLTLTFHEFGHYFTARYHGALVSLP